MIALKRILFPVDFSAEAAQWRRDAALQIVADP